MTGGTASGPRGSSTLPYLIGILGPPLASMAAAEHIWMRSCEKESEVRSENDSKEEETYPRQYIPLKKPAMALVASGPRCRTESCMSGSAGTNAKAAPLPRRTRDTTFVGEEVVRIETETGENNDLPDRATCP